MKKFKIAHVQVTPKLSGAQLFSLQIFKSLPDEYYEKYLITSSKDGATPLQIQDLVNAYEACNVKVILLQSLKRKIGFYDIRCFKDMYRIFREHDFDIVHTNSTKPGIISRIAAFFAGVKKIIHTVHGISYHKFLSIHKRAFYYTIEVVAMCFGDYNVCVNKYYLKYYNWVLFKKSINIYNGYDFSALADDLCPKKFEATSLVDGDSDDFKLLFVGRLDDQKDPMTLLHAFKLLMNQNSSEKIRFTLSIVGDGELYDACDEFCQVNNLYPAVTLHGWSSNPFPYYKASHLFVSPSIYEAFGFTFVEASYFGLPIVATNVEGIPEVVLDGQTGVLVQPKSPQAVADAIIKIASDKTVYTYLSRNSRSSVQSRFGLSSMVASYRKIYEC